MTLGPVPKETSLLIKGQGHKRSIPTFVEECLPLLRPEVGVLVREDELDGVEEVGLARAVPPDNHVVAGVEGLHHGLLAVGLEALDDYLKSIKKSSKNVNYER